MGDTSSNLNLLMDRLDEGVDGYMICQLQRRLI